MSRHAQHPHNLQYTSRAVQQQRLRIAQVAATLILEHGFTDWSHAKHKAAQQLLLPDTNVWPDDKEIEAALFAHQAIFKTRPLRTALLRDKYQQALAWMDRLTDFSPHLCGAFAKGWGDTHQEIQLMLIASDAKAVELALLNAGLHYHAVPTAPNEGNFVLRVEDSASEVILYVYSRTTWQQRRNKSLATLDRKALLALLENSPTQENFPAP